MSPGVRLILIAAVCAGGAAPAWAAGVIGRIVRVGYPVTVGDVVREGCWTPVVVDLSIEGQAAFDGFLRIDQRDKDGDIVSYRAPVHLRGDAGASRRYVLYTVAGPAGLRGPDIEVQLLSEDGRIVELFSEAEGELAKHLLPPRNPEFISHQEYLVLVLTGRTIGRIADLNDYATRDPFDRRVALAHLRASELPELWHGLEMVDCIVWDAADATEPTPEQIDALVDWVQQGGQLLIAASRTADTLAASERLASILPVTFGQVSSVRRLPEMANRLLKIREGADSETADESEADAGDDQSSAADAMESDADDFDDADTTDDADAVDPETKSVRLFRRSIPLAQMTLVPQGRPVIAEQTDEFSGVVIAERTVGLGRVVVLAAELKDLLSHPDIDTTAFFKKVLQMRSARSVTGAPMVNDPFPHIENAVGFRRSTGLYLLGAVIFSIAYAGVATFGTWGFLRSRGWTRHSWTAFAATAGAAAVLSLVAVQAMRGVGQSLQQLTVVDAFAGQTQATATAYFGFKTATHSLVDVWLPTDYAQETEPSSAAGCFLKPMPDGGGDMGNAPTSYADPTRYTIEPGRNVLRGVPVRATLKQFEGRWAGRLRRTIDGNLRITTQVRQDGRGMYDRLSEDSTITNGLDVPLIDCLLVYADADAFAKPTLNELRSRNGFIFVHPIGRIKPGETIKPAARIYFDAAGNALPINDWRRQTLDQYQKIWGKSLSSRADLPFGQSNEQVADLGLELYQDALLMLTTLSEHEPSSMQTFVGTETDFSRSHCRQLDCGTSLDKKSAWLIGFTEDQGPVVLSTGSGGRFSPLMADEAHTMYRVRIPLSRPGEGT